MIVKPTVKELLNHAENRFALVIATSRRARQIAKGDPKLTNVDAESPVTLAANEINEGKVEILGNEENENENTEIQENAKIEENQTENE